MDKCKYMRSETNWTPNDYDIFFNWSEIPQNIQMNVDDLQKRLNKLTPITKKIHLNMKTSNKSKKEIVSISTRIIYSQNGNKKEVVYK